MDAASARTLAVANKMDKGAGVVAVAGGASKPRSWSRQEISDGVTHVLVDALGIEPEEVKPESSITAHLGADSIDILDVVRRLENHFSIEIGKYELLIDFNELGDRNKGFVNTEGRLTSLGVRYLRQRHPKLGLGIYEGLPGEKVRNVAYTVEYLRDVIATKVIVID